MFKVKVYQPGNRILSAVDAVSLATWVSESLDNGSKYLAIDLQYVSFLDSRGLGALVLVHNRVQKAEGLLGICAISGQASMLLELTSMNKLFHIYESVTQFKDVVQQRLMETPAVSTQPPELQKTLPLKNNSRQDASPSASR
ncbi:MAG: STAS domain-containing protein [Cyanobacteria bacterium P01_F01_bin.150]